MKTIMNILIAITSILGTSACALDTGSGEGATEEQEADASFEAEVLQRFGPEAKIVYAGNDVDGELQISAGWCGAEHISADTTTRFGGWIDGNGPDDYTAAATCRDFSRAFGVTRWCGDRRGSVAVCTSGMRSRGWIITHRF